MTAIGAAIDGLELEARRARHFQIEIVGHGIAAAAVIFLRAEGAVHVEAHGAVARPHVEPHVAVGLFGVRGRIGGDALFDHRFDGVAVIAGDADRAGDIVHQHLAGGRKGLADGLGAAGERGA